MSGGIRRRTITLIDGGMGRELKDRGVRIPETIWSAAALIEAPDQVTRLHRDFLDAGAELIISNNYAAVPVLLRLEGLEPDLERLVTVALDCAESGTVKRRAPRWRLPDHSPRSSTRTAPISCSRLRRTWPRIAESWPQWPGRPDLFIAETMSTIDEARAAVTAALESDTEVWASFTLADDDSGNLRDGSAPGRAIDAMVDLGVDTVLFNCCRPEAITAALRRVDGHRARASARTPTRSKRSPRAGI